MTHVFQVLKARLRAVLTALDRSRVPAVMVDMYGRVIVRNQSAGQALDRWDGMGGGKDGRLSLADPDQARALQNMTAIAAATANAEADTPTAHLMVKRPSGADPFYLEVSPIRDTDQEIDCAFRGALITGYDPDSAPSFQLTGFSELHGPTPAEVMKLIIDGAETAEIADRRNASIDTVRTQIKSVLAKTNSRSRTELVRRAIMATPRVDQPTGEKTWGRLEQSGRFHFPEPVPAPTGFVSPS